MDLRFGKNQGLEEPSAAKHLRDALLSAPVLADIEWGINRDAHDGLEYRALKRRILQRENMRTPESKSSLSLADVFAGLRSEIHDALINSDAGTISLFSNLTNILDSLDVWANNNYTPGKHPENIGKNDLAVVGSNLKKLAQELAKAGRDDLSACLLNVRLRVVENLLTFPDAPKRPRSATTPEDILAFAERYQDFPSVHGKQDELNFGLLLKDDRRPTNNLPQDADSADLRTSESTGWDQTIDFHPDAVTSWERAATA